MGSGQEALGSALTLSPATSRDLICSVPQEPSPSPRVLGVGADPAPPAWLCLLGTGVPIL